MDDLVAVIDGRPAVVFGHSFGGDIALAAAERHPHLVRAVGTYEAPMSWEPWWPEDTAGGDAVRLGEEEGPAAAAEAFARRMVGDRIWDRLPPATRADRLAEGPALVGELSDLRRRPPYDPALITVPVLVARGERCAPHHLDGTRTLIERLIAPAGRPRVRGRRRARRRPRHPPRPAGSHGRPRPPCRGPMAAEAADQPAVREG